MNGSDQDSDSLYVTNQPQIVEQAMYCYANYPTIVNNIPKEKNIYSSSMRDYAAIDNMLSHSQLNIGESSNLAQVCLSYTYNFDDIKYYHYVCILSVIAQAAIDSAKRRFDIDISSEIKRIKEDINIKENKYPAFWSGIRKGFNENNINEDLVCPMNSVFNFKNRTYNPATSTLSIKKFLMDYPIEVDMNVAKTIANLLSKYSLDIYTAKSQSDDDDKGEIILLRNDFEELADYIRTIKISHKYISIISWLLKNVFDYEESKEQLDYTTYNRIKKNRSMFLKALYTASPYAFLQCFSKYLNTPDCEKDQNVGWQSNRRKTLNSTVVD